MKLSTEQQQIIDNLDGPIRIIAGPGSGKTFTMSMKYEALLDKGIKHEEILVFSFTNKSVQEFKLRVGVSLDSTNITTFHAFCYKVLKEYTEYTSLKEGWQLDLNNLARYRYLKQAFEVSDIEDTGFKTMQLINYMTHKKLLDSVSKMSDTERLSQEDNLSKAREYLNTFQEEYSKENVEYVESKYDIYWELVREGGLVDIDELIPRTVELLQDNDNVRKEVEESFKYIIVDEFQDTDPIQFQLLLLLTQDNKNITVVGDPDQNIYTFRGTDVRIINGFDTIYPGTKTFFLSTNYRSKRLIVDKSQNLIKHNVERIDNPMTAISKEEGVLTHSTFEDSIQEKEYLYESIRSLIDKGVQPSDIAILIRSTSGVEYYDDYFYSLDIPYEVLSGNNIKDHVIAKMYYSYINFFFSDFKYFTSSVINSPARGVGKVALKKLKVAAEEKDITLWEYVRDYVTDNKKLQQWVELMDRYKVEFDATSSIQERYDIVRYLVVELNTDESKGKVVRARIKHMLEEISVGLTKIHSTDPDLSSIKVQNQFFLDEILHKDIDKKSKKNSVKISTIHGVKGLEFKHVFMPLFVDAVIPSQNKSSTIEEERRIAYVGLTRAQDALYITSNQYLEYKKDSCGVSPFMEEMEE